MANSKPSQRTKIGGRKQHIAIFAPASLRPAQIKKGRNSALVDHRNERLIYRYYFYSKLQPVKISYDYILELLGGDFCLTPTRVSAIIVNSIEKVKAAVSEAPTANELAVRFPAFNWKVTSYASTILAYKAQGDAQELARLEAMSYDEIREQGLIPKLKALDVNMYQQKHLAHYGGLPNA